MSKITLLLFIQIAALKHDIDPKLYEAIVMQESSGRMVVSSGGDIGLAQVNPKTAKAYKLDMHKLHADPEYNLNAGALILADFKRRYANREPATWWCRYNVGSGTMKGPKAARCLRYTNLVLRHYTGFKYRGIASFPKSK